MPKKYVDKVGDEGFKKLPIRAGPYRFVSFTPGVEQLVHDKAVVAPIWASAALSGVGPRAEESALGLIAGYPFSAPYEDVRLRGK